MLNLAAKQFRDIIENSRDGVWVADRNHRIIYANPAMAVLAEVAVEQIVSRDARDGFFEEPRAFFRRCYLAAVDSGQPQAYECKLLTPSGHETWRGGWLTPTLENGAFSGMSCTVQDITQRKKIEEVQTFLASVGSLTVDEPFFPALARFLAKNLEMFYVCIDRLEGDGLTARTLAVWCDGHFEDNLSYALKDTPCGDVVGKAVCCFSAKVCEAFPRDQVLQDLGAQSYLGVTLWGHTGQPIGLIAVIGRTPLTNHAQAEAIMQLVAVRAAGELERMDAESALRNSEDRLQTAQDYARIGYWELARDGRTALWSKQIYRMFGLPADSTPGPEKLCQIVHASDCPAIIQSLQRSLATGVEHHVEYRIRRQNDGEERWVECRAKPLIGADGLPEKLSGFIQDITERKLLENDLRIAAIAFEAQEGMLVTDSKQAILRVNRAFSKITGYSAEEVIGKNPRLLRSGRQDADFYSAMWERIRRTDGWEGEIWNRRKSGEVYPEWLTISAVKDDAGEITNYVATLTDITFRKEAENEIRHLAFYDPLTRLPNRRLMLDRLTQALSSSARHHRHGALMLIDMDNFKTLNDTLGHDVGDQLLVTVASRLEACIREGDTVARLGGDEFVVILEDLDQAGLAAMQAENVARKILLQLSQPYLLDLSLDEDALCPRDHHCTSSIGITLFRDHPVTVDELMKRADTAMYQAKAAGRNALRFFDPDMQSVVTARAAMEVDLRKAIVDQQFVLYYQAQVDSSARVIGAEALLHWQHAERGLVSCTDYIPLSENTGLIVPLGQWVIETACAQLAAWATMPATAELRLAVNVSARQFRHDDFVDRVLAALAQTGANPRRLKLELTESLLVENMEDVIDKMTALNQQGVSFALDDFGTGYSSLSYLKRLPLDQLKIDRSFVRDVLTDPNDAAIARTIVALGQSLGLAVIAEGVENAAQRDFLASHGCLLYQGFFFSRPLPLAGFEAFVRQLQAV